MASCAVQSNSSPSLTMNVGMILQGEEGNLKAWNREAEELLGLMPEQMQKFSGLGFPLQTVWQDGTPFPVENHPAKVAFQTRQSCVNQVIGVYQPEGQLVWLTVTSQPLFQAFDVVPYAVVTTFIESAPLPLAEVKRTDKAENSCLSEHLLEALETISDAFYSIDQNWQFTYLNHQAKQLLDRRSHCLIGKNLWEEFPETVGSIFEESYRRAVVEQVTVSFEAFYPAHDRWYRGRVYPIASGLAVYFQDVTGQKIVEAAFLQHEQTAEHRLTEIEVLYATAPIGLCFIDTKLRFGRINDRLAEINGISAAEHIGKTLREMLPDMADELEPLYQQVIQTGVPLERLEVHGANAAQPGVERDWLLSLYPLKAGTNDQVWGINVMVDEITERTQAAAALIRANGILRSVIDGTKDVIFVKDLQGRYVLANSTAADWLGTTVDAILGQDDTTLFSAEKAQQIQQIDRQVMEMGQSITYEEETLKQGSLRSLLSTKYPWRDAEGNILGMIGILQDISDRNQAELEQERLLQQEQFAREQAEKANRIKDEFLAVLSHELRSPLNPILGWSKLLQRGKLDPAKTKEALASIERNAQLQSQLIEDLLDISRILQGKLVLTMTPVDLSTMTRAALETGRSAAETKNIQVQTIFSPNVGKVSGDASRLQQIVWNLLSNAIKFTSEGGRVEVRLMQSDRYAQIQVSDTGKGISPDFLPYIFEHFRQEDGATTRKFGGLGLGLAIVRQLVELHGGEIFVESPGEGQGATFTIQLPLLQTTELVDDVASVLPPLAEAISLTGLKILVVDDELDSRGFITFVLEQAGAEIVAFSSATEALQSIQQVQPDLLVSDIGMPEMDGYMLIDCIRRQLPPPFQNLLAIALTAYAGEANEQKVLQAGFQRHLAKPVDPGELVMAIAQLIEASS